MLELRKRLGYFFGVIAFFSTLIMLGCFFFLSYVGVKIQYLLVPISLISSVLWWTISPSTDTENRPNG